MTKVKLELTILQANCLAQLAEEADLDTFASCGHSERKSARMMQSASDAIEILRGATHQAEKTAHKIKKARASGLSKRALSTKLV